MEQKLLKKGQLLIAEPFMNDENFKRAVVFLCQYTQASGAFGLVLNRQLEFSIGDVVPELDFCDLPLYYGGPVETKSTLHYLHCYGDLIQNSIRVTKNIYWSGDFEQVKSCLNTRQITADGIRFYVGYSGWDTEQMNAEIKQNSWILTKGQIEHIFSEKPNELWRNVLQNMGGKYKVYANLPDDPMLN